MSGNWKNKMLDHEVTPPEGVWDSITQKLDAEEQGKMPEFAKKMAEYEATPPFAAWDAITAELDNEDGLKVIPIAKRNRKPLYYSIAAAASVILIVGSVIWYNNTKVAGTTTDQPIAKTTDPVTDKDTEVVTPPSQKNLVAVNDTPAVNSTIVIPKNNIEKEELASVQPANTGYIKATDAAPLTSNPFDNNKEKLANSNGDYAVNTDMMNAPDRYVIMTGPDGSSRRVSAKLSSYLGYLTDKNPENEEALDVIIREAPLWKSKLKNWSDKLINNDLSPTLSNFMDVVELSKILSDK